MKEHLINKYILTLEADGLPKNYLNQIKKVALEYDGVFDLLKIYFKEYIEQDFGNKYLTLMDIIESVEECR